MVAGPFCDLSDEELCRLYIIVCQQEIERLKKEIENTVKELERRGESNCQF